MSLLLRRRMLIANSKTDKWVEGTNALKPIDGNFSKSSIGLGGEIINSRAILNGTPTQNATFVASYVDVNYLTQGAYTVRSNGYATGGKVTLALYDALGNFVKNLGVIEGGNTQTKVVQLTLTDEMKANGTELRFLVSVTKDTELDIDIQYDIVCGTYTIDTIPPYQPYIA